MADRNMLKHEEAQLEAALEEIRQFARSGAWGSVTVSFEGGVFKTLEERQTRKAYEFAQDPKAAAK